MTKPKARSLQRAKSKIAANGPQKLSTLTRCLCVCHERLVDLKTHGTLWRIDDARNSMEHGSVDAHLIQQVVCLQQGSTVDAPIVSVRGTEEEEFFCSVKRTARHTVAKPNNNRFIDDTNAKIGVHRCQTEEVDTRAFLIRSC